MAAAMPMPQCLEEMRPPHPLPPYGLVTVPETGKLVGTGWVPELPDMRDYTDEHPAVRPALEKMGIARAKGAPRLTLPAQVDLRPWCSPVEYQGMLGSCTANAAAGIVEYFERRAFNKYINASRLFVYKTTRDLLGWVGDTGAYIRTTMAALVLFGAPPETYWSYTDRHQPGVAGEKTFDEEPTAFIYQLAEPWECVNYICHDPFGTPSPTTVLNNVKAYLAAGIPSIFGFYVFPSSTQTDVKGAFPYPAPGERASAGHAVDAVGYDDKLKITNLVSKKVTTGALLIRNSWGASWGDNGYGWIPYDYVLNQLASDFWSLLNMKWLDTGQFQLQVA